MVDQLTLDDLQSYGGLFTPDNHLPAERGEQRQSDRKPIDADGVLTMDGTTVDVKTIDISSGGMCICSPRQLAVGKECLFRFSLNVGGMTHQINASVQIIYCFYTVCQDFKVGIEFLNITPIGEDNIKQFVST